MNQKYGNLYVEDTIGKGMYKGMEADNRQASVMNLLVAHRDLDEQTAYRIVKTVFDKREDLIRSHKEAENIVLESQRGDSSPVPWHPGAMRYLAERGIKIAQ
jgi:hypothetical protein